MNLVIERDWRGDPAPERVRLRLRLDEDHLHIEVQAPYFADPPPAGPPGPRWGLWDHEVVELFVLGEGDRYAEIELGPHGHHLVLQLAGRRQVAARELPLDYTAAIQGDAWRGVARLDRRLLPPPPHRLNAYAIHGEGEARRYLALHPVPGPAPDFHRLEHFPAVTLGA